jgi:hypothetical protein
MTPLTLEQIEELEKLEKRATPGPYDVETIRHDDGSMAYEINDAHQLVAFYEHNFEQPMRAKFNAELYANSRNALPALLHMARGFLEAREAISSYDCGFPDSEMFCKWMEKYGDT